MTNFNLCDIGSQNSLEYLEIYRPFWHVVPLAFLILFLGHISITLCLFSSPEHVFRGSYCDRSLSGVRPSVHLSVNNFFKNLLLQNRTANLDKTWQESSLGEAVQKLLKEFNSNKNSGCHGNKMAENGKNL